MINIAILDRDPDIADNKMYFRRSWMPKKNPSSYETNNYVWSPEVSTAYYLIKKSKNMNVQLINWEHITDKKYMDTFDFVLIFNHGLSDIVPFWKNKADDYVKAWKRLGTKVWPSYKLASFVMDKCKYYKYLNSKNIPTADTYCVKSNKNIKPLIAKLQKGKLNKVFVKPVGGDSGTNTSSHRAPFNSLQKTVKDLLDSKKYPKIAVQRFMNFSTEDSPEYKCLFVGHKLQYIVKTHSLGYFLGVIKPSNKTKKVQGILKLCMRVLKAFEEKHGPLLMCRIDVGYDSVNKRFFVNELEHAPGTYGDNLIHNEKLYSTRMWTFDSNLAKEIIKQVPNVIAK